MEENGAMIEKNSKEEKTSVRLKARLSHLLCHLVLAWTVLRNLWPALSVTRCDSLSLDQRIQCTTRSAPQALNGEISR